VNGTQHLAAWLAKTGLSTQPDDRHALAEMLSRLGLPVTDELLQAGRAAASRISGLTVEAFCLAVLVGQEEDDLALTALGRIVELRPSLLMVTNPIEITGDTTQAAIELLATKIGPYVGMMIGADSDTSSDLAAAEEWRPLVRLNHVASELSGGAGPLYAIIPIKIGANPVTLAEIQVQVVCPTTAVPTSTDAERPDLKVTLRTVLPTLGRVQVDISRNGHRNIVCTMRAERPATARLFRREAFGLSHQLNENGWRSNNLTFTVQAQFEPLWYGGAELARPRLRLDKRA
jgi:hypothetical protein